VKPRRATRAEFSSDTLVIHLEDHIVEIPWDRCSPRLVAAESAARRDLRLLPDGLAIYWPQLDEHLTVEMLLRRHDEMLKGAA
jgi:hypothetical protein